MSPLPDRMIDRWRTRPDPAPDEAQLYWHILMRDQPQVCALAAIARQRLAAFSGLHFTPEHPWRPHITLVYSTEEQPAAPIITALGRDLPCSSITVDTIHLIAQHGSERSWNWQTTASAQLSRTSTSALGAVPK